MAKTHIQPGNVIDVTLSGTVASEALVKVGDLAGVALDSGVSGDTISVAIWEVFEVAKLSTDDMTQGATVYLDDTNHRVTLDDNSGANIAAGKVIEAAGASTTTVKIKLNA